MKKAIPQALPSSVKADNAGLSTLLTQRITLFCINYIYTGKLEALTSDGCALLSSPAIVYETGAFTTKKWQDAQALPNALYVLLSAVEAIGVVK